MHVWKLYILSLWNYRPSTGPLARALQRGGENWLVEGAESLTLICKALIYIYKCMVYLWYSNFMGWGGK